MIQFGVMANTHPAAGTDLTQMVEEVIAEAQQAERCGFDSFFLTEHHQEPSGYLPSPLPLAAAIAARTSRIRIGTGIAILPLYHPTRLAEDCAVIDIISKGRLILGVGQGYQEGDFAAFGLKVSDRVSLFEEGIEILRRAWTEEKVYFVGKRYALRNVMVTPKPVQKPHPPIWVAALGDEPMKRAGRLGDALLADSFQLPERRTHRYYWRHGSYYQDIKKEEDLDLARISLERLILGSPNDCVERIQTWHREVGADYFLIRFRHPGGPAHPQVLEALELFGREVIPRFR